MENASRALLMAGGILLGILILALMVALFATSSNFNKSYDEAKHSEAIQRFNTNFTKYLGHDLTIHEVITIYNFAKQNGFQDSNIGKPAIIGFDFDYQQITEDLNDANGKLTASSDYYKVEKIYKLTIEDYNEDTGYISKIKFTQPTNKFKCYKKNALGNTEIVYNS